MIVLLVGTIVIPLAARGGFTGVGIGRVTSESRQKYNIFGLSSMICQLNRKLFLYGSLLIVSQAGSMDHS